MDVLVKMRGTSIKQFPFIRIIACFGVVLLHTLFASNVYFADQMTKTDLLVTATAENLLMWTVPCFLMITGALLLNPEKELPFSKTVRYTKRMVIALLVFTLIFQIFDFLMTEDTSIFKQWLYELVTGGSWAHVWYLYLMIGLYLMMPFYKMITKSASDRQIGALIVILIGFISLLPLIKVFGIQPGFYIPTGVIYPVYLFLGYALMKKPLPKTAGWLLTVIPTVCLGLLTCWYHTTGTSLYIGDIEYELFGYQSIFVILQTVGIFSLLSQMKVPQSRFADTVDQCTFGIYLIHMIFIHLTMKWCGFNPYQFTYLIFVAMSVAFFAAALLITALLRKIPGVKTVI